MYNSKFPGHLKLSVKIQMESNIFIETCPKKSSGLKILPLILLISEVVIFSHYVPAKGTRPGMSDKRRKHLPLNVSQMVNCRNITRFYTRVPKARL